MHPPDPSSPPPVDPPPAPQEVLPVATASPHTLNYGDPALAPTRSPWLLSLRSNAWLPLVVALYFYGGETLALLPPVAADLLPRLAIMIGLAVSLQLIVGLSGQVSLGHAAFYGLGAAVAGELVLPAMQAYDIWPVRHASLLLASLIVLAGLLGVVRLLRWSHRLHAAVPMVLLAGGGALVILTRSRWDVGFESLAASLQPALYALFQRLEPIHGLLLPGWTFSAIFLSTALATAIAWLIAGATRDRHPAAMPVITAALAVVVQAQTRPMEYELASAALRPPTLLVCAVVAVLMVWRIARSEAGRAMMAVHDAAPAATAAGIDPAWQRTRTLVFGSAVAGFLGAAAALAGFSGGLLPHRTIHSGWLGPPLLIGHDYGLLASVELLALVVIAGQRSIGGVVIVTAILTAAWTFLPESWSLWRFAFYGVAVLAVLRWRPQGLFGEWELLPPPRRRPATRN